MRQYYVRIRSTKGSEDTLNNRSDPAGSLVYAVFDDTLAEDFASFSCGEEEWQADLRDFLRDDAVEQSRGRFSLTFVFYTPAREPVGYVTLAAAQVERKHTQLKRSAPYPMIPAVLIGRLAIDSRFQSSGYGALIMARVREWTTELNVGCRVLALQVDVRNRGAVRFYEREGFSIAPIEVHRNMQWMFFDLQARV